MNLARETAASTKQQACDVAAEGAARHPLSHARSSRRRRVPTRFRLARDSALDEDRRSRRETRESCSRPRNRESGLATRLRAGLRLVATNGIGSSRARPRLPLRRRPSKPDLLLARKGVVRRGSRRRYWVRDQFDACLTFFANRVRARGCASRCPGGVINPAADPAAAAEQREPVLQHLSGPSPRGNVVATRQRAHEPLWHGG